VIVAVKVRRKEKLAELVEPCAKILDELGVKRSATTKNESALCGSCLDVIESLKIDNAAFSYQQTPNGHIFVFEDSSLVNFDCACNSYGLTYEFVGDSGGYTPFCTYGEMQYEFIEFI